MSVTLCLLVLGLVVGLSTANSLGVPEYSEIVPHRALYQGSKTNVPPSWPVFPTSVAADSVAAVKEGAVIVSNGHLFFGKAFALVQLNHALPPSSKLVVWDGHLVAVASPDEMCTLSCSFDDPQAPACKTVVCEKVSMGAIHSVAVSADKTQASSVTQQVWVASDGGLTTARLDHGKILDIKTVSSLSTLPLLSVAVSGDMVDSQINPVLVVGNSEKLWFLNYQNAEKVLRFEWVTDIPSGAGGVVSSTIETMAFYSEPVPIEDAKQPKLDLANLYIGTQNNLNVRFGQNSSFATINGDHGLPTSNITSIAFAKTRATVGGPDIRQLWIGTTLGVSVWQHGHDPAFRYLYKQRWLAGSTVKELAVIPRNDEDADSMGDTIVVVAEEGVTHLDQRKMSMDTKADRFQALQYTRHNRLGLSAQCRLPSFGDNSETICGDNDNNGLWTSLVVAAAYFKYSITHAADDLKFASAFFGGLVRLNEVTGIDGLMARSLCSPDENPFRDCGVGGKPGQWRNSTNPNYAGWSWKSDTSSDETTGHVFALSLVAELSPVEAERDLAKQLLTQFVLRMVKNNFQLIDWTGKPTTWGKWNPSQLNDDRAWSDGRGVNSLQVLAYIAAAYPFVNDTERQILEHAYRDLTNETNQYNENIMNLKITAPSDDNYSDDELTFLPYFTFLHFCKNETVCPFERAPVLASLERTFRIVRPERPDLWNAIYLAMTGARTPGTVNDMIWNLKTWPDELVCWPTSNEERKDILYDLAVTRFGKAHIQSLHIRSPLPTNERGQGLWNANPWVVAATGDGMSEDDAGAWLLPYWMARYFNLFSLL